MKTELYVVRHGKTMFNTIGRAQGWSDSPLTEEGEGGIHDLGRGLKEANLPFVAAFSSDSGRAIQTATILLEELGLQGQIPYRFDKRIREWSFGSFDGAYGGELFHGVIPRVLLTDNYKNLTMEELANGIVEVDTAGWAEPWDQLRQRIMDGFLAIAQEVEAQGGGKVLVVSHNMTIGTLVTQVDPRIRLNPSVQNASVTRLTYEDGQLTLEDLGLLTYLEAGRKARKEAREDD